jgi:zinc-binding in reverse transcriptase
VSTDPTTPSDKFIKLTTKLPKKLSTILTQLRTGHAPLAKHLHRIKKADSPICPACLQNSETIQHFMLHCPAHQEARQRLRNNTGGRDINIAKLFTSPKLLRALQIRCRHGPIPQQHRSHTPPPRRSTMTDHNSSLFPLPFSFK